MKTFQRIPRILWSSAPGWTLLSTLLLVIEILLGLASLYLVKVLVDTITTELGQTPNLTGSGLSDFSPVLWQVALFGAATLGYLAVRSLSNLAREAQGLAVVDHLDRQIHDSAIRADLAFYESPKYFDTLQRARESGTLRPAQVASNALLLGKNALMLAAVIALMISIDWRLLPILAIAILPALWVRVHFTQVLYDWKKRRTELERRAGYLDWLMTSDIHAKELRLNQMGEFLKNAHADIKSQIRNEQLSITRRRTWIEMAVALTSSAFFFVALGYLTFQTAQGRNTVGDLVLFLLIFQRAQSMGQEIVNQISKLHEDHLYLGLLFEFLDLQPQLTALSVEPEGASPNWVQPPKLEVTGVHFTYPDCQSEVLHNINLTLNAGQVVALVGANGSGKTSLIKLLTRLYDPTRGQIQVDGEDIRRYNPEAYRRLFSVVFQDFACYADSVSNNIRFGDIRLPACSDAMRKAAERAGAVDFIEALPQGFETMLSRMFQDGVDLSHGQWQKIALARAMMDRARIIILDEPSSALDPHAEADLFENFKERLGGRSALLIAHRLSTIRLADWIYVMDKGRIVESGSHETLMATRGLYWDLFNTQGKYFRLEGLEGA